MEAVLPPPWYRLRTFSPHRRSNHRSMEDHLDLQYISDSEHQPKEVFQLSGHGFLVSTRLESSKQFEKRSSKGPMVDPQLGEAAP